MALPGSGTDISLIDIDTEFSGPASPALTDFYRGGTYVPDTPTNSGVPTSGNISIRDFENAADSVPLSISEADYLLLDSNTFDRPINALRIGSNKAMFAIHDTGILTIKFVTQSSGTLSVSSAAVPTNDTGVSTENRINDFGFDPTTDHALVAYRGGNGAINTCSVECSGTAPSIIDTDDSTVTELGTIETTAVCYLGAAGGGGSWFAVAYILNVTGTRSLRLIAVELNSGGTIQATTPSITLDAALSASEADAALGMKIGCPASGKVVIPVQGGICHVATFNFISETWTDNGEISGHESYIGSGCCTRSSKVAAFTDMPVISANASPDDYSIKWVNSSGAFVTGSESTVDVTGGDGFPSASFAKYANMALGTMPDGTTRCLALAYRESSSTDTGFGIFKMDTNTSFEGTSAGIVKANTQSVFAYPVQMDDNYWLVVFRNGDSSNQNYGILYNVTGG